MLKTNASDTQFQLPWKLFVMLFTPLLLTPIRLGLLIHR
jgi:hypothetical protein